MPQAPQECCNETIIDPTAVTSFQQSIDVSQLWQGVNSALDGIEAVTGGGCEGELSGPASLVGTIETHTECCGIENPQPQVLTTKMISAQIDSAGWSCNWPITGIPHIASVNVIASAGLSATINGSLVETCEDEDVCIDVTPQLTVDFGGGAYVGNPEVIILGVEVTGGVALAGSYKLCAQAGFSKEGTSTALPCLTIKVTVAEFFNVFESQFCTGVLSFNRFNL